METESNGSRALEPLSVSPSVPRVARLRDLLGEFQLDAERRHEARRTGRLLGPVTGLKKLDEALGGLLEPGVHVVLGNAGTGKTAFVSQIAESCGFPAVYLSCEMGMLELFRRSVARNTGTYLGRLKSGELDPVQCVELAGRALAKAAGVVIADASETYAEPNWIRDLARESKPDGGHVLLVVDSLHSWVDGAPEGLEEYDRVSAGMAALRAIAGTLECPVVAVVERNRASTKTRGLSSGAGSRKIEYGATSVVDLHRDEDRAPDPLGDVPVDLKIAKNRSGAAGRKIDLIFNGPRQQFREAGARARRWCSRTSRPTTRTRRRGTASAASSARCRSVPINSGGRTTAA